MNNQKEGWEEVYRKKFGLCDKNGKCGCKKELGFIRKLIKEAREEAIRSVLPEEKKRGWLQDEGWNSCLESIKGRANKRGIEI